MTWSSQKFYESHAAPGPAREAAVVAEALKGNVPTWAKMLVALKSGDQVAPDYFAIGTDADFVRAPLTCFAAQFLADKWGFAFPSKVLVDKIWAEAPIKLKPHTQEWWAGEEHGVYKMRYGGNYILHNEALERDRAGRVGLVAGGKKDVIEQRMPGRLSIYGWQTDDAGHVIQPPSEAHDLQWEDYSQGIRFCEGGPLSGRAFSGTMPAAFMVELGKLGFK